MTDADPRVGLHVRRCPRCGYAFLGSAGDGCQAIDCDVPSADYGPIFYGRRRVYDLVDRHGNAIAKPLRFDEPIDVLARYVERWVVNQERYYR